jgi:uncharacterized protein YggE
MDKPLKNLFNMLSLFVLIIVVFIIAFAMPAASKWQSSFVSARTITVSAEGKTTATPDMAEISFSVVSQGNNPQVLSDNNNTKMNSVLQFVSSQNIASSDIATTAYDLQPNYRYDETSQRNFITGYTLTQTVQVKIRDLKQVASLLGGLAPLGVNQIGGVDFTFQNPDKFVSIARGDAITKAGSAASAMAAQAGASLGEAVNISESSNVIFPQTSYDMKGGVGMSLASPVAPTVAAGTQDVNDSVTVTYALK